MTYKEFKKEIEELGLRYKFYDDAVGVCLIDKDYIIALIFYEKRYYGTVNFNSNLGAIISNKLLYLCYDLIRTPLDERGEPNDL